MASISVLYCHLWKTTSPKECIEGDENNDEDEADDDADHHHRHVVPLRCQGSGCDCAACDKIDQNHG